VSAVVANAVVVSAVVASAVVVKDLDAHVNCANCVDWTLVVLPHIGLVKKQQNFGFSDLQGVQCDHRCCCYLVIQGCCHWLDY